MMKIVLIVLAILLLMIMAAVTAAWAMFGEKITAAKSVKKLDDGLYYMEYRGNYGFDAFLEKGGASSEREMAQYIQSFLSGGFMKTEVNTVPQEFGCSTLTVGKLMGRNFDWEGTDGTAMIVHTVPKSGYASYSTCWLDFLGFGERWKPEEMANQYMSLASIYVPLDGINEKGLCVADLINGDDEQTHQKTDRAALTTNTAIRLLLDRAATVDEAVGLLRQYDMNSAIGMAHHLAVSDAAGKSVVIEYIDNEMIVTETSAVTNHYLSEGAKYGIGNEESHSRYEKLMTMYSGISSGAQMRESMECVSYAGITQWSIVYDKESLSIDFWWQRHFGQVHHLTLKVAQRQSQVGCHTA